MHIISFLPLDKCDLMYYLCNVFRPYTGNFAGYLQPEFTITMALSQNPMTGKMSGTVGNFVTSTHRGKNVIRSKAFLPKDANTDAQKQHRSLFKVLSDEYATLAPLADDGFPSRPVNQSVYNAFLAANMPDAVDYSGEIPVIDYSKLVVSKGTLPGVNVLSTRADETGVTVSYQSVVSPTRVSPADRIAALLKTADGSVFYAEKLRGELKDDTILITSENISRESIVYVYLVVTSADKTKASRTVYVSMS